MICRYFPTEDEGLGSVITMYFYSDSSLGESDLFRIRLQTLLMHLNLWGLIASERRAHGIFDLNLHSLLHGKGKE